MANVIKKVGVSILKKNAFLRERVVMQTWQ